MGVESYLNPFSPLSALGAERDSCRYPDHFQKLARGTPALNVAVPRIKEHVVQGMRSENPHARHVMILDAGSKVGLYHDTLPISM